MTDAVLKIERATTSDLNGEPWPPPGDRWQRVRSSGGKTEWRRLSIATTATINNVEK